MKTYQDVQFLEEATETLRAIAHPIRISILELLSQSEKMSVTEIYEKLKIEQAVASHHLRILKNKKVVTVLRDGKNSFYSLTNPEYFSIVQILLDLRS